MHYNSFLVLGSSPIRNLQFTLFNYFLFILLSAWKFA
uniref:Uncharacterized protein n=1 Tax=Rhizophora mucronata TaxID=61149 RepID=A0A2P2PVU0_RHIMU